MARKYFGTDGVRGRVGEAPITADFVMRLGYASGMTLVAREHMPKGERPVVLIGKDTRLSGYMLEAALEAGFAAAGVDVMLSGPMPTPAVAYLTRALRLQAGIVISASHNPYADNGIKFFSSAGTKLPDALEEEIESRLQEPMSCVEPAHIGKARRIDDAAGRYIEFCKSTFPNHFDLRGVRIAVDCANGAAYHIAPKVFHELGAEVFVVGVEPNGLNINDGVGATVPTSLKEAVVKYHADVGVALDGDGDRLVMADSGGKVYDGDQLLYVIAQERLKEGTLEGLAGTLMSNLGLERALKRLGVAFGRAKVGDRYVLEMMHQKGWKLGGENSGHIICLDRHTTGDGIISALQVLSALRQRDVSLVEACRDLTLYPQTLINVKLPAGFDWRDRPSIESARLAVESELGEDGRVLLRPSGTEPLLRVMVEGLEAAQVRRCAESIAAEIRAAAGGV